MEAAATATDSTGAASARWTLGTQSGPQQLEVEAGGVGSVEVTAEALPGPVAQLEVVGGDGQEAPQGMHVPENPTVQGVDEYGNPAEGRLARFQVEEGDGWTVHGSVSMDEDGRASTPWYLGQQAGPQELSVVADEQELAFTAEAEPVEAGESYLGHREFVEYIPGDLPMVITAPHGGHLEPDDIPRRQGPGIVTVTDLNTRDLSYRMADALEEEVGSRPHLVVLHLDRTRLDANRDIGDAALGNPVAERAWHEFQTYTDLAKAEVRERHGEGFYLDLHGHGHSIQRLELGYVITRSELEQPDEALEDDGLVAKSSLRTLVERSGVDHAELIRGETSLGALYEEEGYRSVPSPDDPDPDGNPFFSGGYNTQRHGCSDGDVICGFQLEANMDGVRDTQQNRQAFAEATARVLDRFFEHHYDARLSDF